MLAQLLQALRDFCQHFLNGWQPPAKCPVSPIRVCNNRTLQPEQKGQTPLPLVVHLENHIFDGWHAIPISCPWNWVIAFSLRQHLRFSQKFSGMTQPTTVPSGMTSLRKHFTSSLIHHNGSGSCFPSYSWTGWWFGTSILFSHILGISSSQLTNSYFSEGVAQPPTSGICNPCLLVDPNFFVTYHTPPGSSPTFTMHAVPSHMLFPKS